jgi:hypothetical protein
MGTSSRGTDGPACFRPTGRHGGANNRGGWG